MMRFYVRGVAWVLVAVAASAEPGSAQDRNVGCDGAVASKAGRSGPCTELARTIAGLLEGPAVARDHWGLAVTAMDGAPVVWQRRDTDGRPCPGGSWRRKSFRA